MAIIYDHAVTDARRQVELHQPALHHGACGCIAGCESWPCKPYSTAWAVITRNSNTRAVR